MDTDSIQSNGAKVLTADYADFCFLFFHFQRTLAVSLKSGFIMSYLERAISDGHAKLTGEGKQQKILYVAVNHTERYADPEEQVRAEFWAELIYRYGYEPARIGGEPELRNRNG